MAKEHNPQLTAVEISHIWNAYMTNSLSVCVFKYFLNCVEDQSIKEVVQHGLDLSEYQVEKLSVLFRKENYPVPIGFTEKEDVDIHAPKLFSDSYMLNNVRDMASVGMNTYSAAIGISAREDIYEHFATCFTKTNELHRMAKNLMLEKGIYIRGPYIQPPAKPKYVKKQGFLTGWFGERRPLTGMEITTLYSNIQRNALGASTLIGFAQVAQSKEVKRFVIRGKEIASKHIEVFSSLLNEENLPAPMSSDSEVTDKTSFVFSERLIMFETTSLIATSIGYYGLALAGSMRRDISVHYTRLIAEIMKYAEDGANIMIDNGWLEEPPMAPNRDELVDG
ncbi:DUF3231 family protein [Paucisalibacillus sp. EB02]|uniref:DUF3231 family protein n=1 Tax=Paucisalibacillus sp. EB02 TaxID=1347087 RepID=UPI0004B59F12|nr:DUF3231 family protein [Paucisalibacillus sp. EB02]